MYIKCKIMIYLKSTEKYLKNPQNILTNSQVSSVTARPLQLTNVKMSAENIKDESSGNAETSQASKILEWNLIQNQNTYVH